MAIVSTALPTAPPLPGDEFDILQRGHAKIYFHRLASRSSCYILPGSRVHRDSLRFLGDDALGVAVADVPGHPDLLNVKLPVWVDCLTTAKRFLLDEHDGSIRNKVNSSYSTRPPRGGAWAAADFLAQGVPPARDLDPLPLKPRSSVGVLPSRRCCWRPVSVAAAAAAETPAEAAEAYQQQRIGERQLDKAAREGDTATLQRLLDEGVNPNTSDQNGWTPLHSAAVGGQAEAIGILVAEGAAVDAPDQYGKTPLQEAAYYNQATSIEALLAAGACTDIADNSQQTALFKAAYTGSEAAVRLLLAAGSVLPAPDHIALLSRSAEAQLLLREATPDGQRLRAAQRRSAADAEQQARTSSTIHDDHQGEADAVLQRQRADAAVKAAEEAWQRALDAAAQRDVAVALTEELNRAATAAAVTAADTIAELQRQLVASQALLAAQRTESLHQLQHCGALFRHSALTAAPAARRIAELTILLPHLLRDNDPIPRNTVDAALRLLELDIDDDVLNTQTKFLGGGGQATVRVGPRSLLGDDPALQPLTAAGDRERRSAQIVVKRFIRDADGRHALREALVLALLRHRNILPLEGVLLRRPEAGDTDQWLRVRGLVLPFVEGGTLQQKIVSNALPLLSQKLAAIGDVVSAVAYLHSLRPRAIVHCDIKPENLLVEADGRVTLCDFGVWHEGVVGANTVERGSSAVAGGGEGATTVGGTLRYMAPEALGVLDLTTRQPIATSVGRRADTYSCGVVLWQLFSGAAQPWANFSDGQIRQLLAVGDRPAPVEGVIPAAIQPLLAAMWHQRPTERPYAPQMLSRLAAVARSEAARLSIGEASETERLVSLAVRLEAEAYLYGESPAATATRPL